jgi:hypothetical protein
MVDVSSAVELMIREGWAENKAQANFRIDALLQWMAGLPFAGPENLYVVLSRDLDNAFHAFVLNTRFYEVFCRENFGFFVHHDPLDRENFDEAKLKAGIKHTLTFLSDVFGADLHPDFSELISVNDSVGISVSAITCFRQCYERQQSKVTQLLLDQAAA